MSYQIEDEFLADPFREDREKNLELVEVKKLGEREFKVTLDLGFVKFEGEGPCLHKAVYDIGWDLNFFCWNDVDEDLLQLTRKYSENTQMWLENWCGQSKNQNTTLTFGFKEKYNDPYDLTLTGRQGLDGILAEYRKGRRLAYIYREWRHDDIRLGATFVPGGKNRKKEFSVVLTRDDCVRIIEANDCDNDILCLGQKIISDLQELVMEKIGKEMPCCKKIGKEMPCCK